MPRLLARPVFVFVSAVMLLTAVHVAGTLASRFSSTHPTARRAPAAQSPPVWLLPDGPGLKIESFYASAANVVQGEEITICYGTRNAVRLVLEPAVHDLKPARNRCISVHPEADTHYRLTAWGADGERVTEAFSIKVLPAPPKFLFVNLSDFEIRRGDHPNVCYGVTGTAKVRLEPTLNPAPVCPRCCVMLAPDRTTNYRLRIFGPGGEDHVSFTIKVR
ncbi:MAG: hypothetical protein U5J83_12510 [Bryobacterales bacterium]|nr:hypothetical protein [Bryobacterales bacterium]